MFRGASFRKNQRTPPKSGGRGEGGGGVKTFQGARKSFVGFRVFSLGASLV